MDQQGVWHPISNAALAAVLAAPPFPVAWRKSRHEAISHTPCPILVGRSWACGGEKISPPHAHDFHRHLPSSAPRVRLGWKPAAFLRAFPRQQSRQVLVTNTRLPRLGGAPAGQPPGRPQTTAHWMEIRRARAVRRSTSPPAPCACDRLVIVERDFGDTSVIRSRGLEPSSRPPGVSRRFVYARRGLAQHSAAAAGETHWRLTVKLLVVSSHTLIGRSLIALLQSLPVWQAN